MHSISFMGPCW